LHNFFNNFFIFIYL